MKQSLILCLMLLAAGNLVHAQGDVRSRGTQGDAQAAPAARTVTGKVTDKDGNALVGATVSVVSRVTGQVVGGTYTDQDGNFSVSVTDPGNRVVRISYVNFATRDIPATSDASSFSVTLQEAAVNLQEVVVVGYGTVAKRDLSSSVARVEGASIANVLTGSPDQALQGRASGVQVQQNSGFLGSTPTIRVRGVNSVTQGTYPLIVIDGMQVPAGNNSGVALSNILSSLNADDIESVEVLKDGAATAIYGSQAANGVIVYTTKRGKAGKVSVNYNAQFGWSTVFRKYKVLNANDFMTLVNEERANSGLGAAAFPLPIDPANPSGPIYDTDWQSYIFRTGFQQSHTLSISGGNDKTQYYLSLGAQLQQGHIQANDQNRYNIRLNLDHKVNKFAKVGTSLMYANWETTGLTSGANSLSGNTYAALSLMPNVPAFFADGRYNITANGSAVGSGNNLLGHATNASHVVYVLRNNTFLARNSRAQGNMYLEIEPFQELGLTIRSQFNFDLLGTEDFFYQNPFHGDGRTPVGRASQTYSPFYRWIWQNYANWNRTIAEDHNFSLTAGFEYQRESSRTFFATVTNIADPFYNQNLVSGSFITPTAGGGSTPDGRDGYFGRINYNYKQRYYFGASARYDRLAYLASDVRGGWFPGFSAAWRVSEESFWQNSTILSKISSLKLRGSWATVGNTSFGSSFPYLSVYSPAQYGSQPGIGLSQIGNPGLRWEKSTKIDFGVEMGLFDDRLSIEFDYYRNNLDDLIFSVPYPPSFGIPGNAITQNVGKAYTQGIELQIRSVNISKPTSRFEWTTEFNISTQNAVVTSLPFGRDIIGANTILREGLPQGTLWGYQWYGVNPANGFPVFQKGDGRLIQGSLFTGQWSIFNPENPGNFTADPALTLSATTDKRDLGTTLPKFFGGIRNNVSWRDFDFEVFFTFAGGHKIWNGTRANNLTNQFTNRLDEQLDRWTPTNTGGQVPILVSGTQDFVNRPAETNSRFVESGDFLRLQLLSLGYTLKQPFLEKAGVSSIRFYVQGQNLLVITPYRGIDPDLGAGIDYNVNPLARTFLVGASVTF